MIGEVALAKHDGDGDGAVATEYLSTEFGLTAKIKMVVDNGEGEEGNKGDLGMAMAKVEGKVERAKADGGEGQWR